MNTLNSLQILRAVAAWMVVYHHYMQRLYDFHYSTEVGHFFSAVGPFGVDIFFVISGFIMFYTLRNRDYTPREFVLRRVFRIVPVYWFMTLARVTVAPFAASYGPSHFDWDFSSLALSLLFIPHQNPSGIGIFPLLTVGWTLNYEMFFYVWLSLMLLLFPRAWFVVCTISMLALPLFWNRDWPYASIVGSGRLYEFVFGMFVGSLYLKLRTFVQWKGLPVGVALALTGIGIYWANSRGWSMVNLANTPFFWRLGNMTPHLSAVAIVGAALAFEKHVSRLRALRLLRKLGDMSYSTYLVHPICLLMTVYAFEKPQSLFEEVLAIGAYTTMTLTLSHLSYRWIETGPVMDLLKRALPARRTSLQTAHARVS